jgi:hypothetical protein
MHAAKVRGSGLEESEKGKAIGRERHGSSRYDIQFELPYVRLA